MTPAQQTLLDARALILDEEKFSRFAYARTNDMEQRFTPDYSKAPPRERDLKGWCEVMKPQFDAVRPQMQSMCMVTAILVAAPDADAASDALSALNTAIETHAVDACVSFKQNEFEGFNNYNHDGHKGVLNLLAVASGKEEMWIP